MEPLMQEYDGYLITTDKGLMKVNDIHAWLSAEAYWCKNIPFETVKRAFDNSFCIGVLFEERQIAFARLFTDYATFGYLADVFVVQEHRGKGIGKKMMELLFGLEWVKGLRRIMLATRDAHGLYNQYGFTACRNPDRLMEITRSDLYEPLNQKPLTPEGSQP